MTLSKILTILFLSCSSISFACDSCSDFDYFDVNNKGYIGLIYRYSYYNGYNNLAGTGFKVKKTKHSIIGDKNIYEKSQEDYEAFHTVDLRFNYSYKKKLNFLVVVPYRFNYDYRAIIYPPLGSVYDSTITQKGLGDIYFLVSSIKKIEKDNTTHIIKPGAGFSLPTGRYEVKSPDGIIQDPVHQPGKGAVDFIMQFNYTLKHKNKLGYFSTNRYYLSLKKKEPQTIASGSIPQTYYHRFGNRFSSTNFLFYTVGEYIWKFIPKVGLHYENIQNDYLNGEKIEDLGGSSLFLTSGIDIKFKDFTLINDYRIPIYQYLNGEQLLNSGRFNLGLLYSF